MRFVDRTLFEKLFYHVKNYDFMNISVFLKWILFKKPLTFKRNVSRLKQKIKQSGHCRI